MRQRTILLLLLLTTAAISVHAKGIRIRPHLSHSSSSSSNSSAPAQAAPAAAPVAAAAAPSALDEQRKAELERRRAEAQERQAAAQARRDAAVASKNDALQPTAAPVIIPAEVAPVNGKPVTRRLDVAPKAAKSAVVPEADLSGLPVRPNLPLAVTTHTSTEYRFDSRGVNCSLYPTRCQ